jgi:hypothetical protein
MDFSLSPEVDAVRRRIREFVEERLIPLESDPANYDEHENIARPLLERLRAEAKAQGLWALQMPKARGGGGLPMTGLAVCYEEMNRSIFGPVVFHGAAPDDGNMRLLNTVGTEAQKDRWLQPIIDGKVQSSFAMTEPDGAGSDPSQLATTAVPDGDDYVELMLYQDRPAPEARGGKNHVCLFTPDLPRAVAILEARPARQDYPRPIEIKVGRNRKRQANLFDPDGTRVELMEPKTVDGITAPPSTAPAPHPSTRPAK